MPVQVAVSLERSSRGVNVSVSRTCNEQWNFYVKQRLGYSLDDDSLAGPLVEDEVVSGGSNGKNFLHAQLRALKVGNCAHPPDTAILFHFENIERF